MTTPSWPNDLDALDAALAGRIGREPSVSLRPRVLAAMADELGGQQGSSWWWYAGATAALVLLWAHLSWIACRETTYNWRDEEAGNDLAADVRAIEKLVPDIPPREARREALVLRSSTARGGTPPLAPLPAPNGPATLKTL